MIINVFFKFWRIAATVLLTMVFLFCYTNLPESIAFIFEETGKPIAFTNKQNFFYAAAGIIFGINFITLFLKNKLLSIDFSAFKTDFAWFRNQTALKNVLAIWFDAFLAFINTFSVFVLLGLNNINGGKNQKLDFNYNYLLAFGLIVIFIFIAYLPLRLLFSKPKS
jgi:hypothetical protein